MLKVYVYGFRITLMLEFMFVYSSCLSMMHLMYFCC
uniref:Uncharacterized protein n=1 Tax=Rhizophora mucronata TaxID=61149 RepID=A0A2P2NX24_RHIMU